MKKLLIIGIIVCIAMAGRFSFDKSLAAENLIVIGSISDEPKEEVTKFQPFIDYLARHLKGLGITGGKVVVAGSMHQLIRLIKKETVDIYVDSTFPTITVNKQTDATPLLRRWKKGIAQYNSVIFVREDSQINTLDDLKGKMITFEEEFSTSGYFLPKAMLMRKGYKVTEKINFRENVASDEIGYVFSYDDENTFVWVQRKKVAGGALSNETFKKISRDQIGEFKVLISSIDVPRHILSYRPGLNPELINAMKIILMNMHNNDEGKQVLRAFSNTIKFDMGTSELEEELSVIEELVNFVEKELYKD